MTTTEMGKQFFIEIILLKFSFTDVDKYKKRPALVLLDTNDSDIIVCRITSNMYETEIEKEIRWFVEIVPAGNIGA